MEGWECRRAESNYDISWAIFSWLNCQSLATCVWPNVLNVLWISDETSGCINLAEAFHQPRPKMSSDNHLRPIEVYLHGCNPPTPSFHQFEGVLIYAFLCYDTINTWRQWQLWNMIFETVESVFSGNGHSYWTLEYTISYPLWGENFVCQQRLGETVTWIFIIVIQVILWLTDLHIIVGTKLADGLWKRLQWSWLVPLAERQEENRLTIRESFGC